VIADYQVIADNQVPILDTVSVPNVWGFTYYSQGLEIEYVETVAIM
jgi:hypothetical protein